VRCHPPWRARAGGYLASADHRAFGNRRKGLVTLLVSCAVTAAGFGLAFLLPRKTGSSGLAFLIAAAYRYYADWAFGPTIAQRRAEGWTRYSWFRTTGVSAGFMAAIVAVIALIAFTQSPPTYQVRIEDIPRVLAEVQSSKATPTYAAFVFLPPGATDEDESINVQFSSDDGLVGLDWVLLGPSNVKDQDRFLDFVRAGGFAPRLTEKNGVKYYRVEFGDLATLCKQLITGLYNVPENTTIKMVAEGIHWTR
jgi:hypothetical protein